MKRRPPGRASARAGYFFLSGLVTALLVLSSCKPVTTKPQLTYTVGECNQDIPMQQLADWAMVDIAARDGVVQVRQNINYVCCADINIKLEPEGDVVKLIEANEGDICKCMCGYEANMEVIGLLAGRYTIQVWGVEYPDVHPLELLGEAQVEL